MVANKQDVKINAVGGEPFKKKSNELRKGTKSKRRWGMANIL